MRVPTSLRIGFCSVALYTLQLKNNTQEMAQHALHARRRLLLRDTNQALVHQLFSYYTTNPDILLLDIFTLFFPFAQ